MKVIFCLIIVCFLLGGCSLWPKRVEYFQDKVEKAPEKKEENLEAQKQAADYLYIKTEETVQAAIKENVSTNVLKPAVESHIVANSLSDSLGKPEKPAKGEAETVAAKLDRLEAKFDSKLEDFKEKNNENEGKKIEGTGAFSIGYFTQFIVLFFIVALLWFGIKVVGIFNPAVSVGSKIISGGIFGVGKKTAELANEVIRGGQIFKEKIESEIEDPDTKDKIMELFKLSQKISQSPKNQDIIKKIISPS